MEPEGLLPRLKGPDTVVLSQMKPFHNPSSSSFKIHPPSKAQQPLVGRGLLIVEAS